MSHAPVAVGAGKLLITPLPVGQAGTGPSAKQTHPGQRTRSRASAAKRFTSHAIRKVPTPA